MVEPLCNQCTRNVFSVSKVTLCPSPLAYPPAAWYTYSAAAIPGSRLAGFKDDAMAPIAVPFNDLRPRFNADPTVYRAAVERVFARGCYVLGPEVEAFEREFADYLGVNDAVGVANGTDAIELALRSAGIGVGDEVITVAHTAVGTVCGIERSGARPVFVDIRPDDYTIDPREVPAAVTPRTRAIVAVHLYGQPARLKELRATADRLGLLLIEDCAQAHGARCVGQACRHGWPSFHFQLLPDQEPRRFWRRRRRRDE